MKKIKSSLFILLASSTIAYSQPLCDAEFSFDDQNCPTVSFQDNSIYSAGTIDNWLYDFGDGTTSNVPTTWHIYATNGTYNVCLNIASSDSMCVTSFCDTIVVDCVANLKEEQLDHYALYPNPTNSELNIQFDNMHNLSYTVISVNGAIKLQGKVVNSRELRIDVSSLEIGVYTLIMEYDGIKRREKIIRN